MGEKVLSCLSDETGKGDRRDGKRQRHEPHAHPYENQGLSPPMTLSSPSRCTCFQHRHPDQRLGKPSDGAQIRTSKNPRRTKTERVSSIGAKRKTKRCGPQRNSRPPDRDAEGSTDDSTTFTQEARELTKTHTYQLQRGHATRTRTKKPKPNTSGHDMPLRHVAADQTRPATKMRMQGDTVVLAQGRLHHRRPRNTPHEHKHMRDNTSQQRKHKRQVLARQVIRMRTTNARIRLRGATRTNGGWVRASETHPDRHEAIKEVE